MPLRTKWIALSSLCCAVSCLVVSCGEPDISALQPTTFKPVAAAFLVNAPNSWSQATVEALAGASHVDCEVVQTTPAQLQNAVFQMITSYHVGLCVIAISGALPNNLASIAGAYPNVRFEWIDDAPAVQIPENVRQVSVDPVLMSYAIGWLAGQAAFHGNIQNIGYITDTVQANSAQIRAALAGAYQADPGATMVPVNLAGLLAGPVGVTGSNNNIAGNSTAPPIPPSVSLAAAPRVLVALRPLSQSEWQALSQSGIVVYSLFPAHGEPGVAATPSFPAPNAIASDLQSYARNKWQGGQLRVQLPTFVNPNPALVSAPALAALAHVQATLQVDANFPSTAFQAIPANVRATWSPIIGSTAY